MLILTAIIDQGYYPGRALRMILNENILSIIIVVNIYLLVR